MINRAEEKVKVVVLRCSHGGMCPVVKLSDTEVSISDDFGGSVRLTQEQFKKLKNIK